MTVDDVPNVVCDDISQDDVKKPFFLTRRFVFIVIISNILSVLYFLFLESPQYVSRADIMVMSPLQQNTVPELSEGGRPGGYSDGNYLFQSLVGAWDTFRKLEIEFDFGDVYSKYDLFHRYGCFSTYFQENETILWKYYRKNNYVVVNDKASIAELYVKGPSPLIAQKVAISILHHVSDKINELNVMQENDHISSLNEMLVNLRRKIEDDYSALDYMRNRYHVYNIHDDLIRDANRIDLIKSSMRDIFLRYGGKISETMNNPSSGIYLDSLTRLDAYLSSEKDNLESQIRIASRFERQQKILENDLSDLSNLQLSLQNTRIAERKQHYAMSIVSAPSYSEGNDGPNRLLNIGLFFIISLTLWFVVRA